MPTITIFIIALGLAMDAFAVSITSGFAIKKLKPWHVIKIALFFGFFQGIMPVIGWYMGLSFRAYIVDYDHWIAFGLLGIIGGKMIYESFQEEEDKKNPLNNLVLLILAIATSIDALAVGLSFSFLNIEIGFPALVIGIVTFFFSSIGVYLGHCFGNYFGKRMELIGGLVLIAIGFKILFDHIG